MPRTKDMNTCMYVSIYYNFINKVGGMCACSVHCMRLRIVCFNLEFGSGFTMAARGGNFIESLLRAYRRSVSNRSTGTHANCLGTKHGSCTMFMEKTASMYAMRIYEC